MKKTVRKDDVTEISLNVLMTNVLRWLGNVMEKTVVEMGVTK